MTIFTGDHSSEGVKVWHSLVANLETVPNCPDIGTLPRCFAKTLCH